MDAVYRMVVCSIAAAQWHSKKHNVGRPPFLRILHLPSLTDALFPPPGRRPGGPAPSLVGTPDHRRALRYGVILGGVQCALRDLGCGSKPALAV